MTEVTGQKASYLCHVFAAAEMTVTAGVNTGDALGAPEALCLGDVYELAEAGQALRLAVRDRVGEDADAGNFLGQSAGRAKVAEGSEAGRPGAALALEARLTFMAPDGGRAELLTVALAPGSPEMRRYFLPLTPLEPGLDYTLIEAEPDPAPVRLADIASVAFTRGTRITMADGSQRPVEELRPGDLVLTRDSGPRPLRHALGRTLRAVGAFAPVAIPKGTLGNANDLVVSQHQRLFLYQRGPDRIGDRAEILVRAGDLVDGETVFLRKGGFADYVSLVFDRHEVIYAECIPAESLLVNDDTRHNLPEEARPALSALSQAPVRAGEAPSAALAKARPRLIKPPGRG